MKILVVSQYYYPEQFRITEICEELVRRGHAVTVLTGRPNSPEGEVYPGYAHIRRETHNGVEIVRCQIRPRKHGAAALALNYMSFLLRGWLRAGLLPKDFDIEDLLVVLLLLLMAGEEDSGNALLTLALYLFL